jgi:tRNA(Ile)-lysidine synthase
MVLALASLGERVRRNLVVAHVRHDLRPGAVTREDERAVVRLAAAMGLECVRATVRVRTRPGNAEANARRARYAALERLARRCGCRFVATAHHADDQAESVVMALIRGAGPRGLAGIAPRRRLGPGVDLIRPCLGVRSEELRRLCRAAGWAWREDATNLDLGRLRARVRHEVIPLLERVRPGAVERIADAAWIQRALSDVVRRTATRLARAVGGSSSGPGREPGPWSRAALRRVNPVVLGEMLRAAVVERRGGTGSDRVPLRTIRRAVEMIRDRSTEPREVIISGAVIEVHASTVRVRT